MMKKRRVKRILKRTRALTEGGSEAFVFFGLFLHVYDVEAKEVVCREAGEVVCLLEARLVVCLEAGVIVWKSLVVNEGTDSCGV